MPAIIQRQSPSGRPRVITAIPNVISRLSYTAAAPLVLELLPSGHEPGLYQMAWDCIVRTAAGGGSLLIRTMTYSAPTFGTTSPAGGTVQISVTGHATPGATTAAQQAYVPATIESDGTAPILMTLTPSSVSGSPVIDIYVAINPIALDP